jgi:hypothetical protein
VASETGIVNRGLIALGESPITSLDDPVKAARLAKAIWPELRDAVLREHPWNGAIKRTALAALATTPAFEWAFEYAWPADALRILAVNEEDFAAKVGWTIEGRLILTDWDAPLNVRYVFQQTDANTYDPMLRAALSARLAMELAMPLTQDRGKRADAEAAYQAALDAARAVDGLEEEVTEDDSDSEWVGARYRA